MSDHDHDHITALIRRQGRLSNEPSAISSDYTRHLTYTLGRFKQPCSAYYRYCALSLAVRDRLMYHWKRTGAAYRQADPRRTYYISLEFLMGRALGNAAFNLDLDEASAQAMHELGLSVEDIASEEPDAGLGNGGLGRLAACFIDSCATLQLPVMGYGIRYEYGMFRQRIVNGDQKEEPDHWLVFGNPWEVVRHEHTRRILFGGHTEFVRDPKGGMRVQWVDTEDVLAVPYDVPIPGYRNGTVNTLRLWKSAATNEFDLADFNAGDYTAAIEEKSNAENISMVLYPNDSSENGKELRLRQQYFLASASLQDILRRWHDQNGDDFSRFADKNCMQLNDTHPTIAIPELMRLLMDEHGLGWDEAWSITSSCMAYTNHTLLPEALERWPVALVQRLLPRLMEIIYEINARFVRLISLKWPGENERISRMSIIEDGSEPMVRMAWLAIIGSFSVNGVAQLHSDLLCQGLFKDFYELEPKKFNNKTNGVTQRRWLAWCNRPLAGLISSHIGEEWITDLDQLNKLAPLADSADFRRDWRAVQGQAKERLANIVKRDCGIVLDTGMLFDVQVKRIHEYKRQLLNILHAIHLYDRIKRGDTTNWCRRAILIGGKAAPGYHMAKRIIKLANNVADVINTDPDVGDLLKMAFLPNYRVSSMEVITPGADLSEQISTAGKEASGTGNMKFMMNGALTIGTLDGANIEIREEVGEDAFFLFGLSAEEVEERREHYDPQAIIEADSDLKRVMQLLRSGHFNHVEPGIFNDIINSLTEWGDYWMIIADFRSYLEAQRRAAEAWADEEWWTRASIRQTAASGKFSTDRCMRDYNRDIWRLEPLQPLETLD